MKIKRQLMAAGLILSLVVLIFGGGRSPTTIKANTFTLTAKVNNTANNNLGNIELDWSSYTNKNITFKGYQSKDNGKTWQTMSLMDYTSVKEVKVLQIYPIEDAKNQLKTWMETNGYGKGIIKVDSVYINDFNNNPEKYIKDDKGNWKYDELFFGTWDGGGSDLTITSTQIVEQYIKDGKGCIFGHDTIYNAHPNMWSLRNYFNIAEYSSNTFPTGNKVYISKKGLFTSYPWNIGEIGQELTIPNAHSQFTHQAKGDIWLRFSGYEENNQNFYLTTYNNCAMIQTGHSKGQATEDEQKIIANLIFYSYQSSSETSVTDNSAMDTVAPDKPSVTKNGNNYNLSSKDNGTIYKHKIEAYDLINTSTLIDTSNVTSSTVISGFKGYRYIYNNTANTKITGVNGTAITNDIIPYDSRYGYLHVAAVDNAGNVSETVTITINQNTINYNVETIYPSWAVNKTHAGGTIDKTSEVVNGNQTPIGATATAGVEPIKAFYFDGWYSSSGELITKDTTIKPLNCNAEDRGGLTGSYLGGTGVYDASTDIYSVTVDLNKIDKTFYDALGCGVRNESSTHIPWNNWYISEFEIWSPVDCTAIVDINNEPCIGNAWNGNDNDATSVRPESAKNIKANTWTKMTVWYQNSSPQNTSHVDLIDLHAIDIRYNRSLGNQTFKIRNHKAAVSPTLVKELDTFTARFKPYEHTVSYDANGGTGAPESFQKCTWATRQISSTIPTRTGYTFKNWNTKKDGSGTTYSPGQDYAPDQNGGTVTLYAQWTVNTYTNNISHWLRGFKNAEGNNDSGDAFHLAETYFSAAYKSSFVVDSSRATQIPNGCYVNPSETALFWEDGVHWSSAIYGTITQKAYNMVFQYGYRPYDYSITYNLNGGTNNNANPSTYTVLYGVSLKAPTRAGYTFTGWYDEKGNKVTGINEGCNATFSSADDLYAKLAKRTTGNRTLTARWSYNPVKVKVPQILTGDHTGNSSFRVKCDDIKADNIKVSVPNNFPYKQAGKADITATITAKSGNNTITPTNKVCVYNITTKNGLTAGCWQGSFNIGLTLTKE